MSKELLSPQILERLQSYDSATISNALEHFKVRDQTTGYATSELVCQFPDLRPMVGYAMTCTADTTRPGDDRPSRVGELVEAVEAAPKPCVIVIQHTGHDRPRCCFLGDMFSSTMEKLGSVGVVTDGNCRDKPGIHERTPNFQVFSAGWVVSHGWGVFYDFNVTVTVSGLTIQPGDLLHGDCNGLMTLPADMAEPVLQQAGEVVKIEQDYFKFLDSDEFTMDEMKRRFVPH